MATETSWSLKHLELNKRCIHFEDVSQSFLKVTEKRLERFVACREKLAKLKDRKSVTIRTCLLAKMGHSFNAPVNGLPQGGGGGIGHNPRDLTFR